MADAQARKAAIKKASSQVRTDGVYARRSTSKQRAAESLPAEETPVKIRTLWKQWDDDALEILCAMDENICDIAWEGWHEQVEAACKRYGIVEGMDTREVLIEVPSEPILAAFADPVVQATAVETTSEGKR